jgi:hypothetical protein
MWDLWWTKWRWGRFSPSTSVSPANLHSTNFSTITITYHLGLLQQTSKWPQYPKSHRTNFIFNKQSSLKQVLPVYGMSFSSG